MPIVHDRVRAEWELDSQPVHGSTAFPPMTKIKRIVVHYPGADFQDMDFDNDEDIDWEDTGILLRNTQNYYLVSRGFSIGYNTAIGQEGDSWELRGDTWMCAANQEVNADSYAINILVDAGAPANPHQVRKMRELVKQIRALAGWAVPLVDHHSVSLNTTNTSCPGPGIMDQLARGVFEPRATKPDIPDGKPLLKRGVVHSDVMLLRSWLVWLNYMQRKPDPRFGYRTEDALKALQRTLKVTEDGVYGPVTSKAFMKYLRGLGF